jgi:hypothetical protein
MKNVYYYTLLNISMHDTNITKIFESNNHITCILYFCAYVVLLGITHNCLLLLFIIVMILYVLVLVCST